MESEKKYKIRWTRTVWSKEVEEENVSIHKPYFLECHFLPELTFFVHVLFLSYDVNCILETVNHCSNDILLKLKVLEFRNINFQSFRNLGNRYEIRPIIHIGKNARHILQFCTWCSGFIIFSSTFSKLSVVSVKRKS